MDLDLAGVHVLVTGANGGIGLDTVKVFLEQGAHVTAHYRSSSVSLQPLADSHPSALTLAQADLASESAAQSLFSSLSSPVEVLVVNHAVYSGQAQLKDMSLDHWSNTLDNNLTSSFLVVREYLKGLEKGIAAGQGRFGERAAIVSVGSTAGKYGEAGSADYAASKSALMYGFTLSLKNEIVKIAPRGRVNCVAPGWVKTPMATEALANPSIIYQALATTPLKKVAEPRDVANQIALLASSRVSGHVTGQVLMVEGGMEGRLLNRPGELGLPADA
ncbi:NAD-P-binding protein [Peniophora sp. CONT]|nr:NAD-P-binding protein [Peniophora sp. CONT]